MRETAKWLFGGLLVVALGTLLVVLALANITADGPAKRSLEQGVAILTEVDALLDDHYEALRLEAEGSAGDLTMPEFPIEVTFSAEEVRTSDRGQFRALLLSRAAGRVHEDGVAVMREDREGSVDFFSTEGMVRTGMDFLRPTPHRVLTMLTIALASLSAVLALGLALSTRGYGRVLALGVAVVVATVPFLVAAVAVRFAFRLGADGIDEYLAREFFALGNELAWAPIRTGIIFAVGGGIVLAAGATLARWSDATRRV